MSRKSQETCAVFEFDDIAQWGAELIDLFKDRLPKRLSRVFEAEPPDDVEHAREILIPHLGIDKRRIELQMKAWFRSKRVAGYVGDRLTDEEVKDWSRFRSTEEHFERLRRMLGSHPRWPSVADRARNEVVRAMPNSMRRGYRRTASASKRGLLMNFNAYLPEHSALEERAADALLGRDGLQLARAYGTPRICRAELLGENALKAAKRFAGKTERDPNPLVWVTFDAWAYWLADEQFSPADECWYVGLDLNPFLDAGCSKGAEAVPLP